MMKNKESHTNGAASFTELNKVLEEKVNNLMADVDLILSKQVNVIRLPKHERQSKQEPKVIHFEENEFISLQSTAREYKDDYHNDEMRWIGVHGNDSKTPLGHSKSNSLPESLVRFFKGQITKLQTDLQTMQYEKKKMEGQCKQLEAQVSKKEENEKKLLHQINYHKDNILKAESANSEMCLKMQAQNTQIISLNKEIENLKSKLASLNQQLVNNELRLNRNIEDNDKLRASLKISQTEEKEAREYIRKIQEEKRLSLKALEKQRTDIFQAFEKQMQLIDNLRKQKFYMETNKQVQFLEKEFEKILESKVI